MQGSSWGYLKVNSSETLSIFGDKCPQNGSKNDLMAPRTTPHEGPSVARFLQFDAQTYFICFAQHPRGPGPEREIFIDNYWSEST